MPAWRDAAGVIGALGVGLEDTGYVGGVLWSVLTDDKARGDAEEQRRIITDRPVRRAVRDGGDSSRTAAAIRPILDEYLPDGSGPSGGGPPNMAAPDPAPNAIRAAPRRGTAQADPATARGPCGP